MSLFLNKILLAYKKNGTFLKYYGGQQMQCGPVSGVIKVFAHG
jgi:hypothetical protein